MLDENKMSIVLLSTAANVISCHTSMVGIDKNRTEKVVSKLVHRNVPMTSDDEESSAYYDCIADGDDDGDDVIVGDCFDDYLQSECVGRSIKPMNRSNRASS